MFLSPRCRAVLARPGGKVLALFGALLPFLVGGMALSVDTGVLGTARAQLQTAADAAALAGAMQLALYRNPAGTATMMAQARARAIARASTNRILGEPAVLRDNPQNTPAGEIVIGALARTDTTSDTPTTTGPATAYNAVKITLFRDASHGGAIPGFFAGVLDHGASSLRVSATATLQNYAAGGFQSVDNLPANLLPIVLDKATYDAMLAGTTTDQYEWSDIDKVVYSGSDGIAESKLYPIRNGNPGNWGTVKIGVSNNSTSTLGAQIRNGITPAQLATFPNGRIQLNASLSPPSITFEGNPGISAGIKDDLASIIGRPVFVPIYDQSGGNGNNAWYRVVKFAGVRLLGVDFQGNPKYVIVQPSMVNHPAALPGPPEESLSSGGLVRLHLSR